MCIIVSYIHQSARRQEVNVRTREKRVRLEFNRVACYLEGLMTLEASEILVPSTQPNTISTLHNYTI